MVMKLKQRYLVNGKRFSLDELYRLAKPTDGKKSSHTTIVFARYIVLSWQNRCSYS
ncbi:hypothetical protein GCM10008986_11550 [Salinibacillus aidingensis]|uniref:Uncharacterized protein n=1 Tax=Salinibacillus aidingensis TaxID=237684 RepID=A0ABP3KVC4_9BACI